MTEDKGDGAPRQRATAIRDLAHGGPTITATGEGHLAEQILNIAFAEGVKVRKDPELTDLLAAFDVDSPVPLEALVAVGEILERVRLANQVAGQVAGQAADQTGQKEEEHHGSD